MGACVVGNRSELAGLVLVLKGGIVVRAKLFIELDVP